MSANAGPLQLSGWRGLFLVLVAGAAAVTLLGGRLGLTNTTNLNDPFPSGLCFGLDVFCCIALAAGSLTLACVAYIIGGPEWRIAGRACLLLGSLSYGVAILGALAYDNAAVSRSLMLGGWSARSPLSGAVWSAAVLAVLLGIEFLPEFSLPTARKTWFAILRRLDLPLAILAALLAIAHQYGLHHLLQLSERRFSPLWTGPSLPSLFYLSSLALALAVLLFASWRSWLAFGKSLPSTLHVVLARALVAAVFVYLAIRLIDLMERGLLSSVLRPTLEGLLILLEIVLLLCGMMWIHGSEIEFSQMFVGCALIIAGVVANRLNTAITALEAGSGQRYLPRWSEFFIACTLIAAGVAGFAVAVKHLPVFCDAER